MRPIILILLFMAMISCNNNGNVIQPEMKPLMEAVYASGIVVARNQYQVFAQAEGYVEEKVADDGSVIKKGEPLYILESGQQSSRFDLARKNYRIAQENYSEGSSMLREIEAALQSSETKMKFDSVNFVRYSNLLKSNATSKADYDRFRLAYENSRNEFTLQKSRYNRVKNQLYLELENAKSQLTIAGNESGKYIVRSELDGKVFKTLKEKGELVRRGEAVAIIGDQEQYYLELAVDEQDIQKIVIGQEVLVTVDAYPGKVFKAEVEKIFPFVNQQQQSLRVDAALKENLPGFFSGLAIEANIVIRKSQKALVVPRVAVRNDTVKIETEEGVRLVKVSTGIQTFEEIEIVSGIDSNSHVVVPEQP